MKDLKNKMIVILGILPSILLVLIVFKTAFSSPLIVSREIGSEKILPQGWAFFTKSPRDVRVELYDFTLKEQVPLKNFSFTNVFGIKRTSARICTEISALVKETPDSLWVKSDESNNNFYKGRFISKESAFVSPYLNKQVVIINKERTPWAWSKFETKIKKPITYLKIKQIVR